MSIKNVVITCVTVLALAALIGVSWYTSAARHNNISTISTPTPTNMRCLVDEPAAAKAEMQAIQTKNAESLLAQWDASVRPDMASAVDRLFPPSNVTINSIEWIASCQSPEDTLTMYVVDITVDTVQHQISFIVRTNSSGKVIAVE